MKKAIEILKKNKVIIAISALLIVLIAVAWALFGGNESILKTNSTSTEGSESEIKLMRILSEIDGVGRAEVMINEGEDGVEGVVIVCEGANNIMTRSDVINAVSVALKVDRNEIAIYAMK